MWPRVSLPSSPYAAASGSAPTPTLSRTIRMTRANTARVGRGEVVGDGALRSNGGDRVLEHQVISAFDVDDHREAIEVLDPRIELAPVDQVNADRQPFAPRVVEKCVLDVRRRGRDPGFSGDLGHLVERS